MKVYEEVIDFIAMGTTPHKVIDFQPSAEVKERVAYLLQREKDSEVSFGRKGRVGSLYAIRTSYENGKSPSTPL